LLWNTFFLNGLQATANARNLKRYVFQLGLSNQVVRQIYLLFNPTQAITLSEKLTPVVDGGGSGAPSAYSNYAQINGLKNIYASKAITHLPDGERIQIRFNQQNLYNQPLQQNAHKIHELQTAYGANFFLPQSTYDMTDSVLDEIDVGVYAGEVAGRWFGSKSLIAQQPSIQGWSNHNCAGSNHYVGINLQKAILTNDGRLVRRDIAGSGTRCGPVPVNIEIDRLCPINQNNDDRNLRVCTVVEKSITIKYGLIEIVDV